MLKVSQKCHFATTDVRFQPTGKKIPAKIRYKRYFLILKYLEKRYVGSAKYK